MPEYNVLILSAGRRVELVQCFQQAAARLGLSCRVVAGDCSSTAPALYFADRRYQLPRITEPNYIDSIVDVCSKENISLIVPTIDTELLLLARHKKDIEEQTGAKLLVSSENVIEICRDKNRTQAFLERHHFGVPKMYTIEDIEQQRINFPLFIKPKSGSSSVQTYKINNMNELEFFRNWVADPIIQQYIEGDEYTVDVFLDFESNVITIVPRLRLATRSGEISKGKIVKDREIICDVHRLMTILKPIGQITVQLKKTGEGIKYIEINPRFGGGAPMSIRSGADSCENLFRLLRGERLQYHENYRDQLIFIRFDSCICLNENMEIVQ